MIVIILLIKLTVTVKGGQTSVWNRNNSLRSILIVRVALSLIVSSYPNIITKTTPVHTNENICFCCNVKIYDHWNKIAIIIIFNFIFLGQIPFFHLILSTGKITWFVLNKSRIVGKFCNEKIQIFICQMVIISCISFPGFHQMFPRKC